MKKLLFLLLLLPFYCLSQTAYDSNKVRQSIPGYGFEWNNVKFKSSVVIAIDTPHLAVKDSGAIGYKHGSFYGYNGYSWSALGGNTSFSSSTLDSLYSLINTKVDTTGYSLMWQPLGVYDIGYNQVNDSVRLHFYSDGSTRLDTVPNLRSFSQSTYTSLVTFLNYYDSLKGRDTTKIVSIVLNGTDTTLKIHPNPNNRNDTLFFHMDSVDATHDGYATTYIWRLATGALQNYIQNGRIYGGVVTWLHDYVYNVSEAYYYIDGVLYHSPSTDITLSAADATNDRFDLFVLTTSNTAIAVPGTPAATPLEPDYDANTQLQIDFALVTHNTTEPPGVVANTIYKENLGVPTEWAPVASAGTINPASTSGPYAGSKVIEGTNVANAQYLTLTAPAGTTLGQYNTLSFVIKSKGNFSTTKKIVFRFFTSASNATGNNVPVGSGSYSFVSTNTTSYQPISIPLSDFGNISTATILRITQSNTSGTAGWRIDNIQLQNVQGVTNTGNLVSDVTKNVAGDSFYIWKNGVIVSRLKDASGATAFDSTSLSNRINLKKDKTDSSNAITGYTTLYQNSLKQNLLSGTGFVKSTAGTITYVTSLDSTSIPTLHSESYYNTKYQGILTLTTTGSSGAATLTGNTLNIPQYSGGGTVTTDDSTITATSGQTVFTFPSTPPAKSDFEVYVWGVKVDPSLYTWSGATVTFLTGLVTGDKVNRQRHK